MPFSPRCIFQVLKLCLVLFCSFACLFVLGGDVNSILTFIVSILSLHPPASYKSEVKWKALSRVQLFVNPWIVHGILQVRILEWVPFPFSMGSSQPRDWTQVSCIADGFFTSWVTREAPASYKGYFKSLPANSKFWVTLGPGSLGCLLQIIFSCLILCQQSGTVSWIWCMKKL